MTKYLTKEERSDILKNVQPTGQGGEEDKPGPEEKVTPTGDTPDKGEVEVDGTPNPDDTEKTPAAEGDKDTIPTSWMGLDLSDIEPDKRQEIIGRFKESDANYTRLSQKLKESAKEAEATPPAPEVPAEEPPSDEELLKMLGYDPNDEMYEVKAEVALPLGKALFEMAQKVDQLSLQKEVERFSDWFNTQVDAVEEQFGPLPEGVTREDILEVMDRENIGDPTAAYHRITAPARQFVQSEADKVRQEAREKAKKAISTQKPRPTSPTGSEAPPTKMTAREAAAAAIAEVTGQTISA